MLIDHLKNSKELRLKSVDLKENNLKAPGFVGSNPETGENQGLQNIEAVKKADKIFEKFSELPQEDNVTEKLILGEYNEELSKQLEDHDVKKEFRKKLNAEIDKELIRTNNKDVKSFLVFAKNSITQSELSDCPIPSNVSFKGAKYISNVKRNAVLGNDLSRLKTESERVAFERKLGKYWGLGGKYWKSESDFDNSVVNGMKDSYNIRDRIHRLIKNKTNMSESKLNSKLKDYDQSDIEYLFNNAKECSYI